MVLNVLMTMSLSGPRGKVRLATDGAYTLIQATKETGLDLSDEWFTLHREVRSAAGVKNCLNVLTDHVSKSLAESLEDLPA